MPDHHHAARLDHLWRAHADAQQTIRALDAKAFGLLALCAAILALVSNASDRLSGNRVAAWAGIAGALLLLTGGALALAVVYPRLTDGSMPRRGRRRRRPESDRLYPDLFGPDVRRAHADAAAYWAAHAELDAAGMAERVASAVYLLGGLIEAKAAWVRAAAICTGSGLLLAGAGVAAGTAAHGSGP